MEDSDRILGAPDSCAAGEVGSCCWSWLGSLQLGPTVCSPRCRITPARTIGTLDLCESVVRW